MNTIKTISQFNLCMLPEIQRVLRAEHPVVARHPDTGQIKEIASCEQYGTDSVAIMFNEPPERCVILVSELFIAWETDTEAPQL